MLKVLLAGGGTGGHINPALSIAQIIKAHRPDAEFLFAGTPNGMESRLIPKAGYDFSEIKVAGFQRQLSIENIGRNLKAAGYLCTAGSRARHIINEFHPDIVIGTGGYVSGPVLFTAAQMKIPTVIHEQNAYPGITTKLLTRHVDEVMLTVEAAAKYFDPHVKYTVTGLPVREEFFTVSKAAARRELGLNDDMCILSCGGSLGAGAINDTARDLIEWEQKNGLKINHIHGYGGMGKDTFIKELTDKGVDLSDPRLRVSEYIYNMGSCLAAADLIISRSGASSLAEIEAIGRASILIPSPIVAENHQYHNAMVLSDAGAAVVFEQRELTSEKVIEVVEDFYNNRAKLESFSERAASLSVRDTAERIWAVISRHIS